jgi:hypothetical protein
MARRHHATMTTPAIIGLIGLAALAIFTLIALSRNRRCDRTDPGYFGPWIAGIDSGHAGGDSGAGGADSGSH